MSVNKVILLGRLGNDPESKHLPNGNEVCNFSIATSEKWKKDGETKEKIEWHRIVCFNQLAAIASKFLKKGSQAYIEGKIQTRSWDKEDGSKQYATEILASSIQFIGSKDDSKQGESKKEASSKKEEVMTRTNSIFDNAGTPQSNVSYTTDDIPF